ncbi:hypothetical protein TNCV_4631941 [Trichonephila clavipes]|nr:hypothetical protein TNCV_4631941 [Trichonephila clavipes]
MKRMKTRATARTKSSKGPTNADAFSALETVMELYEQQSECCSIQLLVLKRVKDHAAKKRRCTMESLPIGYIELYYNTRRAASSGVVLQNCEVGRQQPLDYHVTTCRYRAKSHCNLMWIHGLLRPV